MRSISCLILLGSIALAIGACGGGDSKPPDPTQLAGQTATAVAEAFDPNVLTALALQPSDVPPGLPLRQAFENSSSDVVVLDFNYGDDPNRLTSIVGWSTDSDQRKEALKRERQVFIKFVGDEANLPLSGSDQAFSYSYTANQIAGLATKGDFFVAVRIDSAEARPIPVMKQELTGYLQVALAKVDQYLANPSAVTPVPGTIMYTPPVP